MGKDNTKTLGDTAHGAQRPIYPHGIFCHELIYSFICLFIGSVLLHSPGCPGSEQSSSLSLPSTAITDMCHHAQVRPFLIAIYLMNCLFLTETQ
jgi:hypothetical protein